MIISGAILGAKVSVEAFDTVIGGVVDEMSVLSPDDGELSSLLRIS